MAQRPFLTATVTPLATYPRIQVRVSRQTWFLSVAEMRLALRTSFGAALLTIRSRPLAGPVGHRE